MLEMLKARKEALQERGVKGFTLMEMLIVIAIIAVLVAIAIPVLGAQLDRAKATTDEANIRDGYASAQVMYLQDEITASTAYYLQKDGSVAAGADNTNAYECQGNSSNLGADINLPVDLDSWSAGDKITFTFDASGNLTIAAVAS